MIELALALRAAAKGVGPLDEGQRTRARGHDVEQDFETDPRQVRRELTDNRRANHEAAAHRLAEIGAQHIARAPRRECRLGDPNAVPIAGATPSGEPRSARDTGHWIALTRGPHRRQQRSVTRTVPIYSLAP